MSDPSFPEEEQGRTAPVRRVLATGLVWMCPTALLVAEVVVAGHVRPFTVLVSLAATLALLFRRPAGRVAAALLALADALAHAVLVPADSRWLAIIGFDLAVVIAVVLAGKPVTDA